MVMPIQDVMTTKNMWIFMKPFSLELWLTIFMASIFVGISIGILELRASHSNPEFQGPLRRQLSIMLWVPISMVVFPERRMVVNKWSKFVLLVWLVLSFILFQCYTAKLTSMLISVDDEPQHFFNKLERPYIAGYRNGSFVKDFLVEELKFSESRLMAYTTIDEYQKALSKGSRNGGVDAIFDELPYVNFLLLKYGSKYTKVGPIAKTSAFGFKKSGYDELPSISPQSPSLKAPSFIGLFIITGVATIFGLVCSEISRRFSGRLSSNRLESRVLSIVEMSVAGDSPIAEN
ncbi:glutamate receptor 2.8-like [Cornus florida]|uniref:glutamate receptor 2.8-like n=1 Tax=Cornus florida TaxID=4283 RepID=UPI00289B81C1|nr:glutamate receptor 2.8-like [Cornus florida]